MIEIRGLTEPDLSVGDYDTEQIKEKAKKQIKGEVQLGCLKGCSKLDISGVGSNVVSLFCEVHGIDLLVSY